jgi:hypothetical protein
VDRELARPVLAAPRIFHADDSTPAKRVSTNPLVTSDAPHMSRCARFRFVCTRRSVRLFDVSANAVCSHSPNRSLNRPWHCNSSDMAAGDAQRVWFPEMIERLRSQWHQRMSFDAIIELPDDLDTTLQRIRSERHIRSPVFRCPRCGHVGQGAEPHVGVHAMILSLTRFDIAPAERTYALEKGWAAYRKQNGLDLYGKSMTSPPTQVGPCVHPQVR